MKTYLIVYLFIQVIFILLALVLPVPVWAAWGIGLIPFVFGPVAFFVALGYSMRNFKM